MDKKLRNVLFAAALAQMAIVIDFFGLNLALPGIAEDFNTTTSNLQWIISGYMITLAAFFIIGGRFGDMFGRKKMIILGGVIFGTTSLICAVAPNETILIISRLVQGVGAAIMWPNAVGIVANSFPKKEKQKALALLTAVATLGTAFGPLVGGLLTEFVSWRFVFFINVPISLAVIIIIWIVADESRDKSSSKKIDFPGVMLISSGLIITSYAIDKTSDWGWLSISTIATLLTGILLLAGFFAREARIKAPLVDLTLFKNKAFMLITAAGTVGNAGLVAMMFLSTIFLQQINGWSAAEASFAFLALSAGVATASQISERKPNLMPNHIFGFALFLGGLSMLLVTLSENLAYYITMMAFAGFGLGLAFAYSLVQTQSFVDREKAGEASGVTMTFLVSIGGIILAIIASVLSSSTNTSANSETDTIYMILRVFGSVLIASSVLMILSKKIFLKDRIT